MDNNGTTATQPRHPIQVVSRQTKLSPDVLRAWERRYKAVQPARTASGRRLYSDADLERLQLLRRAIRTGRSIAQISTMSDEELRALVMRDETAVPASFTDFPALSDPGDPQEYLALAADAIETKNPAALRDVLVAAGAALEPLTSIEQILVPVLRLVARSWSASGARQAHRHVAAGLVEAVREQVSP